MDDFVEAFNEYWDKNMKVEITHIKLKLKDREIELTSEEARLVRDELNKLFKAEESPLEAIKKQLDSLKQNPSKEYVPYPVYHPPIIIDRGPWWPHHWDTIYCGGNTSGALKSETLCMTIT